MPKGRGIQKETDTRAELVPEAKHLDVALPCMYNHVCIVNAFLVSQGKDLAGRVRNERFHIELKQGLD